MIGILYILLSLQNLTLVPIGENGFKAFHVGIIMLFLVALTRLGKTSDMAVIYRYLTFVICVSLIDYIGEPVDPLIANYVLCYVLALSVNSLYAEAEYETTLKSLRWGAVVILAISATNVLLHFSEVRTVQSIDANQGVRPELPYLVYAGGANLEASWIALAGAFFVRERRLGLLYVLASIFIDYSFISRSGFIATVLVGTVWFYHNVRSKKLWVLAATITVIAAGTMNDASLTSFALFDRFSNVGSEPGSLGRLLMWAYIPDAFLKHPFFGYGAGNAINSIRDLGFNGLENNVHNYFFHNVLEFGPLGLILWLLLLLGVMRIRAKPELRTYCGSFLLLSMIEFRGAEPLLYFVLSILIIGKLTNDDKQQSRTQQQAVLPDAAEPLN
ncbi:O-antigen ligase family protein [Paraburkholderia diazotrophica]|uniref:O-antigen ligase family protein n=1 Tax=Paraburkholderia diazotrophica TaxID=667676 RepID=UPI003175A2EC